MRTIITVMLMVLSMLLQAADAPEELRPISRPLLRFANEPGKPIAIVRGAESLLAIHYGSELDPARFRATLNGKDVSAAFHPRPRSSEAMKIPFAFGINHLEFDVWRQPRPDLPAGALMDNEIHRLQVIVRDNTPDIRGEHAAGLATPTPGK